MKALYRSILFLTLSMSISMTAFAQIPVCDSIPLEYVEENIKFNGQSFNADSAIIIPIVNNSTTGFAYPQAKIVNLTALPSGMSFHVNSLNWEVFASAYNPGDTMSVYFSLYVTDSIPLNYTVDFRLYATNLSPLSIDSCVFSKDFTLNLNSAPLSIKTFENPRTKVYPNPANEYVEITFSKNELGREYQIVNMQGQLMKKGRIDTELMRENLEDYQAGVYFLKATFSNHVTKLVVLK